MFLKLKRPGRKSEIHPFTIAAPPTYDHLQATIKQSGNFTDTIDRTKTTDTAFIEGPYGQFSFLNFPDKPLLMIARGVGITPIMSMIRYLRDTEDGRTVILLYGNQTAKDIIFRKEMENLSDNFTVVHTLADVDEDWNGLKGFITKEMIAEYAQPILDKAEVFLCGPPPMMNKFIAYSKELNIPGARIHYERFTI